MKGKPPPDNQQAPQVSQYNKNVNNTLSLYLSYLSISAAVLWPLLIENPVLLAKNISLAHREHLVIRSIR